MELPVYLGAAWIMTMRWGAIGAAAVWSGRLVVDTVARFVIVHRAAHLPWLPRATRRLRSLALPVLLVVACIGASVLPGGLAGRAAASAALVVGYCAALWWGVLTAAERLRVAGLVVEAVGRPLPVPGVRPLQARDDVGWQSRADASSARGS